MALTDSGYTSIYGTSLFESTQDLHEWARADPPDDYL